MEGMTPPGGWTQAFIDHLGIELWRIPVVVASAIGIYLIFLLLAPEGAGADHLKALARIAPDPEEPGRIRVGFDLVFLTGWAPADSQPKPLRPGSAQMSLADALSQRKP